MTIKIGTRKSPLALAQAREVESRLKAAWPGLDTELVPMSTSGDAVLDRPLVDIGGKGLFTKEIEEALLDRRIDMAVHSMKDMPTVLPEGLMIAAMLEREDARDKLVGQGLGALTDLPHGAAIGTSSLRRAAQVLMQRPDIIIVPLRGNVQTRLAKIEQGVAQATLLAMAGLNRLGLRNVPGAILPPETFLPAVAQGAIGIECREDHGRARELLGPLSHKPTELAVCCERAFLRVLDGSCRMPIAGYADIKDGNMHFRGLIASPDGGNCHTIEVQGDSNNPEMLGVAAGEALKHKAAR